MPYQLTGTLKLPDGTPAANVDIEFVSQANYSPLVRDLSNTIRTSATGSYSVALEYGEYAIRLLYASAYPLHPGKIYVYADTPAGQDLPTLMQVANSTPATPDYIIQIQNWLVEAKAAHDGAVTSAAEAKASELAAKASEIAAGASSAAAIIQHEAKAGAHPIAGVDGLQAALDAKLGAAATAAAATKLATARTIGGVSFDGSASINLPGVNVTGNQPTSGNAATATKLETARTLTIGNTGKTFDGSANQSWSLADIGALPSADNSVWKNRGALSDLTAASSVRPGYFSFVSLTPGSPVSAIYGHGIAIGPGQDAANSVWSSQLVFGHDNKIYTRNAINAAPTGSWNRIYTTADKPTASDVGALALTGGTLAGDLSVESAQPTIFVNTTSGDASLFYRLNNVQRWIQYFHASSGDLITTGYDATGGGGKVFSRMKYSDNSVTFAGPLAGTSATFSGSVTAGGVLSSSSAAGVEKFDGTYHGALLEIGSNLVPYISVNRLWQHVRFNLDRSTVFAGVIAPVNDNVSAIGSPSARWSTVYAGTGAINTSDAREKTAVTPLNDAEIAAAGAISREIGTYQWLESIKQKGGAARHHVGLTVQRAIEIMEAHGLDPFRYGFICCDQWEAEYQDVDDEAGDLVRTVERPVARSETRTSTEIKIVDGVPTQITTVTTELVPVYEDKAVVDEAGNPVLVIHPAELDEDGGIIREAYSTALTHPVPVMESVEVRYRRDVVREAGDRYSFRMDQLALFCLCGIAQSS